MILFNDANCACGWDYCEKSKWRYLQKKQNKVIKLMSFVNI